jgi:predicted transcriptional regulator
VASGLCDRIDDLNRILSTIRQWSSEQSAEIIAAERGSDRTLAYRGQIRARVSDRAIREQLNHRHGSALNVSAAEDDRDVLVA